MKIRFKDIDGQPTELEIADGADPRAAVAQHKAARNAKRAELQAGYEAERPSAASTSGLENFKAGMGRGAVDMGRSAMNMLGLKSDESLRDDRALDKDLLDTGAGQAGNIAGQAAVSSLAGGALGAGARAASAGARSGSMLARTMGALGRPGLARTATEGAAIGALNADPDQRMGGAVQGAVLGSGAHGAGQVLKRAVGGLVKPTAAAASQIQKGNFVPLHLAAEESGLSGAAKVFYRDILRAVPGASGMLRRQTNNAMASFRNSVAQKALPKGAQNVVAGVDDIDGIMKNLDGFWQKAWKPFQGFKVMPAFTQPLQAAVAKAGVSARQNRAIQALTSNTDDLLRLRNEELHKLGLSTDRVRAIQGAIDDVLKKTTPKKAAATLDELRGPWEAYMDLQEATATAARNGRQFRPADLAVASASRVDTPTAARGGGALQALGEEGRDALGGPASDPGFWQRAAVMGGLGGAGLMSIPAAGALVAGGAGLATQGTQKALMGQTQIQQIIADLIRQNQGALEHAGRAGRAALVSGAQ